jgi:hypothetical protein
MTLIREGGELVAVVGRTRAYLLPHVEGLPETDELRRRTLAKCLYALAIAAGRAPGLYRATSRPRRLPAECGAGPRRWRAGSCVSRVPV